MDHLLSLIEPWSRFTAGLIAAMFLARGLDFLPTWIVTPKLELEANRLMRRLCCGRVALTLRTQMLLEKRVVRRSAAAGWTVKESRSGKS